jgi:hypothetical protein
LLFVAWTIKRLQTLPAVPQPFYSFSTDRRRWVEKLHAAFFGHTIESCIASVKARGRKRFAQNSRSKPYNLAVGTKLKREVVTQKDSIDVFAEDFFPTASSNERWW